MNQVKRSRAGKKVPAAKKKGCPSSGQGFRVLVAEDGLFFRVACYVASLGGGDRDAIRARLDGLATKFRASFQTVWQQIPRDDRGILVTYWRTDSLPGVPFEERHSPYRRPLVEILDHGSASPVAPEVDGFATELRFPADLVTGDPSALSAGIARILAMAYRVAIREHWDLVIKMVEDPMDRWEARQGAERSEAAAEKKHERLVKAYMPKYEAQIESLLDRWGLRAAGDQPERQKDDDPEKESA